MKADTDNGFDHQQCLSIRSLIEHTNYKAFTPRLQRNSSVLKKIKKKLVYRQAKLIMIYVCSITVCIRDFRMQCPFQIHN